MVAAVVADHHDCRQDDAIATRVVQEALAAARARVGAAVDRRDDDVAVARIALVVAAVPMVQVVVAAGSHDGGDAVDALISSRALRQVTGSRPQLSLPQSRLHTDGDGGLGAGKPSYRRLTRNFRSVDG